MQLNASSDAAFRIAESHCRLGTLEVKKINISLMKMMIFINNLSNSWLCSQLTNVTDCYLFKL